MKRNFIFFIAGFIGLMFVKDIHPRSGSGVKPDIDFGKIPLYFIANHGQVKGKAKFYAKASRYTLWLTKQGLVFDSFKKVEDNNTPRPFGGRPFQEEKEKFWV